MSLRVILMGSPDFSLPAFQAVHQHSDFDVVAVYSQPPRPKGRGKKEQKTPIHEWADTQKLPVFTPKNFKVEGAVDTFKELKADVAIVAAYGLILPKVILDAPVHGCINIHASLLPRWRGAAPIHRAIEAGDQETGITIMQMDEGLDTGNMLSIGKTDISDKDTGQSVHDRLADMGADLIIGVLEDLAQGRALNPESQDDDEANYAQKIDKSEMRIDWSQSAETIAQKIRAFSPWPGTFFEHNGKRFKVYMAELVDCEASGQAGQLISDDLIVVCGDGHQAIQLDHIKPEGKSVMSRHDVLNGYSFNQGDVLS